MAEEVRAWRGRRDFSTAQLAREAGLKEPYLSKRLAAASTYPLTLDDLEALADALDVHPLALFPDALIAERNVPMPRRPEVLRPPARPRQSNGPRGRKQ